MKNKFDVLAREKKWDKPTQNIIENKLVNIPPVRFFSEEEGKIMQAIIDRVIPPGKEFIPVLNLLDEELFNNRTYGYRYTDQLPRNEFWRSFINSIQDEAKVTFNQSFVNLDPAQKDLVLEHIRYGKTNSWRKSANPERDFIEILTQITSIYYSHPYAWNEIHWAGPIYPESYFCVGCGLTEPWEPDQEDNAGRK